MKILALNASHRGSRGHTGELVEHLMAGAAEAGAATETIPLARREIRRCLACKQCQTPAHYLRCVLEDQDDVRAIFDAMAEADLLIYATPIYLYAISGLLKTLFDRFYGVCDVSDVHLSKSGLVHHHIDREVCAKPFVTLITCGNVEAATTRTALTYFKTYSRFMDAPRVGILVRNAADLLEQDTPRVRAVRAAYVQAGRELATQGRIQRRTQRRANRELIPVPLFALLRRLPLRPIKRAIVREAREMASRPKE